MKTQEAGGEGNRVSLFTAIAAVSYFASFSILMNYYTYATTNNETFPLLGVVLGAMLSILLARGGNGWLFVILPLALLTLGLLQTVHLGILTAVAVLYAIYCCHQLLYSLRSTQ